MILERIGGLAGGGFLYQAIPVEMDANAAAAVFVRDQFGGDRVDALLSDGDKDGAAFRSRVAAPPINMLPERILHFFAANCDLCERHAERQGFAFPILLDSYWQGAGAIYERLLADEELRLPR